MASNQNLFSKLTNLFRNGPTIKRRVKNIPTSTAVSALEMFRRSHSSVYNSTLSAYGAFDRMSRYSDFSEMEATPEIASALDIYAEETCSADENGRALHIYSDDSHKKDLLETLFLDTLNLEFNLVMWVRNLCKYGDFFLFNDVHPEFGIINAYPIPISEMEREEAYDTDNPMAVRFRWLTQGNAALENWQVSHFRLLGNDSFLPYGSSVLESARRIWRQLILIEDAMLVYRVIRAPERRVFYIDVGNVPPEDVANYLEQATTSLKRANVVDKGTGKVDLRFNPLSVDEDYFIPVRGGDTGTRIDTLAGGQNTAAIEDVEYIQKKLFAALKIPRAYLGYDEDIGAKATLAQEDIRFSRTIHRIQKTIISELNKMAMIHLFAHGYEGEELLDFELKLSNPSSIAQLQKLELISTKFDIGGKIPEGLVDRRWVQKNVMGFTDDEIERIETGRANDKIIDAEVEAAAEGAASEGEGGAAEPGEEGGMEDIFASDSPRGKLLTGESDDDEEFTLSLDDEEAPIKAQQKISKIFNKPKPKPKQSARGPSVTHMPDFKKMVTHGRSQDSLKKPFGDDFLRPVFEDNHNNHNEKVNFSIKPNMTPEIKEILQGFDLFIGKTNRSVLNESVQESDEGDEGES